MTETAAIDFANQAFYEAFAAVDFEAMESVWAESVPVSCSHPGAPPLFGRPAVLDSWRQIFSTLSSFPISYRAIRTDQVGELGIAHSLEMLEGGTLLATNLFIKEGKIWRMVHHHAGPARFDPQSIPKISEEPIN